MQLSAASKTNQKIAVAYCHAKQLTSLTEFPVDVLNDRCKIILAVVVEDLCHGVYVPLGVSAK